MAVTLGELQKVLADVGVFHPDAEAHTPLDTMFGLCTSRQDPGTGKATVTAAQFLSACSPQLNALATQRVQLALKAQRRQKTAGQWQRASPSRSVRVKKTSPTFL